MLTAAFTLTHNMQLSNFLELEHTETSNNVEKVQNAVLTQQGYLDYINQDWACWDDTYKFIEDRNQESDLPQMSSKKEHFFCYRFQVITSKSSTSPTGSENHLSPLRFQNTFRLNV